MVRVNLEVTEEKKRKWEREAEEHPESSGNLSAFIRACVEKEIADGHSDGSDNSEEVLKKLGNLGDSINQVHDRMQSMESRLSSLESTTHTDPEIDELKGDVFDLLPDVEPGSPKWQSQLNDLELELGRDDVDTSAYHGWKGTIESLSKALDTSEYAIDQCIDRLQENTQLIRTTEYGDETRYYKVI